LEVKAIIVKSTTVDFVRESDIPGLERYARRFEEAIEKIRLRRQGLRGRGDK
jgi:hypothetical protein